MFWRVYIIISEIISILLTFAPVCPAAHSIMQDAPDNIIITEKNNGGKLQIAPGCILILKLEAIPGTGYAWQMVQNNPDLLKSLGESVFEPIVGDTKQEILGGPEYQVFRFKARKSGTDILELHYKREWGKEVVPVKTFRITVRIQ
jgi:predicted secreted protein